MFRRSQTEVCREIAAQKEEDEIKKGSNTKESWSTGVTGTDVLTTDLLAPLSGKLSTHDPPQGHFMKEMGGKMTKLDTQESKTGPSPREGQEKKRLG